MVRVKALLSSATGDGRSPLMNGPHASHEHRQGSPGGLDPKAWQSPRAAFAPAPPGQAGDTTAVNAADAAGNLFSAGISGALGLHRAFIARDTRGPPSPRLQQFNPDPQSPNGGAPKKRPRLTPPPTLPTQ